MRSRTSPFVSTAALPPGASNPLRNLPAALAMRHLAAVVRPRLQRADLGEDELVALLQLDPLAVVRGLRCAHAPVFRGAAGLASVRRMVQCLGPHDSRRLLQNDPVPVPPGSPLRSLWLHAVATAIAVGDLAASSGLIDREAAYLLGLLHDLPDWLAALRPRGPGAGGPSPTDWIAHWQLPAALIAQLHAVRSIRGEQGMLTATDVAGLVRVAERLAVLAGFPHPSIDGVPVRATGDADPIDRHAAERLRHQVHDALAALGLDPEADARADAADTGPADGPPIADLDAAVLAVVGCARADRYRGIVGALTQAAMRHGAFDHAYYGTWQPHTGIVTLRWKADAAARRMTATRYQTTPAEHEALRSALGSDRPVRLEGALRRTQGLLGGLSVDELLAVPMNPDFVQPGFLLLDRALTMAPVDRPGDITLALTLSKVGSLLHENLLLRRRRQRALKFALTDPLTRLFNRRMGLLAMEQEVARTERSDLPLTVLMCDLDHFKQLNDSLGHLQGDFALRAAAEALHQNLRKGDTICRYGGEEFLIVLPDTTPDDAAVLAARLFTTVHNRGEELGLPLSISIGLTAYRPGDTVETLLHRADHALFASKGYGRNRFSADVDAHDDGPVVPGTPT